MGVLICGSQRKLLSPVSCPAKTPPWAPEPELPPGPGRQHLPHRLPPVLPGPPTGAPHTALSKLTARCVVTPFGSHGNPLRFGARPRCPLFSEAFLEAAGLQEALPVLGCHVTFFSGTSFMEREEYHLLRLVCTFSSPVFLSPLYK